MAAENQLAICVLCRPERSGRGRTETGGQRLLRTLETSHAAWARREGIALVGWECLGACDRACAVSLRAPGKFVTVLGGLDPVAGLAPLVEFATAYARAESGYVARADRPHALRSAVVASVPPEQAS